MDPAQPVRPEEAADGRTGAERKPQRGGRKALEACPEKKAEQADRRLGEIGRSDGALFTSITEYQLTARHKGTESSPGKSLVEGADEPEQIYLAVGEDQGPAAEDKQANDENEQTDIGVQDLRGNGYGHENADETGKHAEPDDRDGDAPIRRALIEVGVIEPVMAPGSDETAHRLGDENGRDYVLGAVIHDEQERAQHRAVHHPQGAVDELHEQSAYGQKCRFHNSVSTPIASFLHLHLSTGRQ